MLPYVSYLSWKIGPITIQSFGLMMAIGFLVAVWLFARQFKEEEERDTAYNIGIIAIIAGIIGSRILFLIENPGAVSEWWEIFAFWSGGLSWFGGFIGALIACLIYLRIKRINFWGVADKIAPSLAIGHAIGRVGCILGDGGHVGKLTTMPWGFNVNGEIRHVTAWYELIGLLALFVAMMNIKGKKYYRGFLFQLYLVSYSLLRFVTDFFREEVTYYGLTVPQYICIVIFLVGVGMIVANLVRVRTHKR